MQVAENTIALKVLPEMARRKQTSGKIKQNKIKKRTKRRGINNKEQHKNQLKNHFMLFHTFRIHRIKLFGCIFTCTITRQPNVLATCSLLLFYFTCFYKIFFSFFFIRYLFLLLHRLLNSKFAFKFPVETKNKNWNREMKKKNPKSLSMRKLKDVCIIAVCIFTTLKCFIC